MRTLNIFLLLFAISIISCKQDMDKNNAMRFEVTWELVSSETTSADYTCAEFTIVNKSTITLNSINWEMYFSQIPRPLKQNNVQAAAKVVHINGDYYKLVPEKNFLLKPGDSVKIRYSFDWPMLKTTDAPKGLFFVVTENGKQTISEVDGFRNITGYLNKPGKTYFITPEEQYNQNKQIQVLPKNLWQKIIPAPYKIIESNEEITLNPQFRIVFSEELYFEAQYLQKRLNQFIGEDLFLAAEDSLTNQFIELYVKPLTVNSKNKEAYILSIEKDKISIIGSDASGILYGIQSLLALVPVEYYEEPNKEIKLPCIQIEDSPRFAYRGLHIDVCRHFQPKEEITKIIDLMACYKLNTLLLYLTEDEGWRLEIKDFPELTEVGSKRGFTPDESDMLNPAYGSGPYNGASDTYGTGFYTREDFKEIITYAAERHIDVIPGINLPGHARAAIKSMEARHNRLMAEGKTKEAQKCRLIDPTDSSKYQSAQFYNDNVVNVALESVYAFYETVINDVVQMYAEAGVSLSTIFTGGDEVPEGVWTKSSVCNNLKLKLNETDSKNLQAYFFSRILKMLNNKNITAAGWEEIALRKNFDGIYSVNIDFLNENVTPYAWNNMEGSEDLGNRLANSGYKTVLCLATNFYFDMAYNNDPYEPGLTWAGYTSEFDPWIAEPFNMIRPATEKGNKITKLKTEAQQNILGLQAQMWGEAIVGEQMLEYHLLPKLYSFAERCWAAKPVWEEMSSGTQREKLVEKEWNNFINTVSQQEIPKLNYLFDGFNYRIPSPGAKIDDGLLYANSQYPGLPIYYSTDGNIPDENSKRYEKAVKINSNCKLISIDKSGRKSRVVDVFVTKD